jgi:hypothetical protein
LEDSGSYRSKSLVKEVIAMVTQQANLGENRGSGSDRLSRLWIAALLAGIGVVAAIATVNSGALPTVPAKILLGATITLFFAASFAAVRMDGERDRHAPFDSPPAEGELEPYDHVRPPSEPERVYSWRRTRLKRLGVHPELRGMLAAETAFSIHELEQLLAAGCPLGTALRILQSD